MTTRKTRSLVFSYFDLLDPNRVLVLPGGYSKVQLAQVACDWGSTASQIATNLDADTDLKFPGTTSSVPKTINTRWLVPGGKLLSYGPNAATPPVPQSPFEVKNLLPSQFFQSFSVSYSKIVPPFISVVVEGLDAPENRVAVLSPALQSISNGSAGTSFNIVDKNMKIRLVDPWGSIIINPTFTMTLTLLE